MRRHSALLAALLAALLCPAALAAQQLPRLPEQSRFRVRRPVPEIVVGDTVRLMFDAMDAIGRRMSQQPAAGCLSLMPAVEFESRVVARGKAVGAALALCVWMPPEGVFMDTLTIRVRQREPDPDSVAYIVTEFCYPRVARRWLSKHEMPTIEALRDSVWVRARAYNYRGDWLRMRRVEIRSLDPSVLEFVAPVEPGAMTPCGTA